jgi:glycosyltransferase involved in cell wall biosynthesis
MKIHSFCIAKNEADIIEQTLKSALNWSDFIYVFDNGSEDGTWEKVLALSKIYEQVIPYKQDDRTYNYGIHKEIFEHYRSNSSDGDWWCRLDADEIYIDDPRIFLSKIPLQYQWVWSTSLLYCFTDKDLELYTQNPSLYADDVPVEKKFRYYINNWSEARFFRYHSSLVWDAQRWWPNLGATYPVRIWLKHYPHRSPEQIQRRMRVRLEVAKHGKNFRHEAREYSQKSVNPDELWKVKIADASTLNYDNHDRKYIVREQAMPKLPSSFPHLRNQLVPVKAFYWRLKHAFKS